VSLDFSRQLDYVWALLPEIVLCVWAMLVLVAGVSGRHRPHPADGTDDETARSTRSTADLGWLALVGVLIAAFFNGWLYGVNEVGSDSMIAVDSFRLFANWIFLIAAALAILISFAYVDRQRLQAGEFHGLILLSTAGMMFMAGARDLIVIFLGLEVMSIAVYAMSAFNRRDRRSAEAGLKYFLLGAFSTGFFLYGVALVYGATGSTNVVVIGASVASGAASAGMLAIGVALLTVGFAFKVSAVPFHMWTPDVYEGAPAPVTAFMSVAVKAAAFMAFLRVFRVGLDAAYDTWYPILWWLAAITMVGANLIALVQSNVKRMLAYSSIAHAGYLLSDDGRKRDRRGWHALLSPRLHDDEHWRLRHRHRRGAPGRGPTSDRRLRRIRVVAAGAGRVHDDLPSVARWLSRHRRLHGQDLPAAGGGRL
jgi:proton-translocating NADH-quinone oxidoreductase chain N